MLLTIQLLQHKSSLAQLQNIREILFHGNLSWQCDAKVNELAEQREKNQRISLQLHSCVSETQQKFDPQKKNIYLYGNQLQSLFPGDHLIFQTRFFLPHQYKNFVNFDQNNYLLTQNLVAYASLERILQVQPQISFSWQREIAKFRLRIAEHVDQLEKSDDGILLKAMSVGWKEKWDDDLRNVVATTGIAHLVAISGFQVTFVAWFLSLALGFIFSFFPKIYLYIPRQKLLAILVLPAIWGYVFISGLQAATLRAGVMLTVILIGKILLRKDVALVSLCFAALLICFFSPYAFLSVSFQLSFAAMLALIWLHPVFWEKFEKRFPKPEAATWWQKIYRALAEIVSATLATTLLTLPIQAYAFYQVSFFGILMNLVAVPFAGFIHTPLVMLGIAAEILHFPAQKLWYLSLLATKVLSVTANFSFPLAEKMILHVAPPFYLVGAFFALVFAWVHLPKKKLLMVPSFLLLLLCYFPNVLALEKNLRVYFLDVGQGDSTVLQFPGGEVWVLDGGGSVGSNFDVGKQIVAPQLWRLGIHRVDKLLVSHPDVDHYEGLSYLLQNFHPKELWIPAHQEKKRSQEWITFLEKINELHVVLRVVSREQGCSKIDDAEMCIQNPDVVSHEKDSNNNSLVILLKHGINSFLFPGDIERRAEARLLGQGLEQVNVLKVSHHGSRGASSENFLQAVKPEVAVVSVGENNFYHLPNKEVLDRLEEGGAKVLRTDEAGVIICESNSKELTCHPGFPKN